MTHSCVCRCAQGPDSTGLSAEDLVNKWDPVDLKRVLKEYGEEPKAARIARAIVQSRPLNSTAELRDVVERQVAYNDRAKTLARVFQVHDSYVAWRRGRSEDRHPQRDLPLALHTVRY